LGAAGGEQVGRQGVPPLRESVCDRSGRGRAAGAGQGDRAPQRLVQVTLVQPVEQLGQVAGCALGEQGSEAELVGKARQAIVEPLQQPGGKAGRPLNKAGGFELRQSAQGGSRRSKGGDGDPGDGADRGSLGWLL
jgi:hypothetical protein